MKVLFTGMSSSHCSDGKNRSFFRTLASAYSEFSDVVWSEPKLNWSRSDLEVFDEIIFGFAPPTSMTANHLYGAINVLDLMYESPKLKLVIDSPQVWQYKNSINAFKRDPDQIFGSFYVNRKNYTQARNGKSRSQAESLSNKFSTVKWPVTLIPSLPWSDIAALKKKVGFVTEDSVVSLNLDALLLTKEIPSIGRKDQWAVDNIKSNWAKTTAATLRFPTVPVKANNKPKDSEVEERIKSSMGALISPQDRNVGTWWSYRYIQALNTVTPIATYWQDSRPLSEDWGLLAYQIEDMQPYERQHVAFQQLKSYQANVPDKGSALRALQNLVIEFQPRGK